MRIKFHVATLTIRLTYVLSNYTKFHQNLSKESKDRCRRSVRRISKVALEMVRLQTKSEYPNKFSVRPGLGPSWASAPQKIIIIMQTRYFMHIHSPKLQGCILESKIEIMCHAIKKHSQWHLV
jgi:hypothetical protein